MKLQGKTERKSIGRRQIKIIAAVAVFAVAVVIIIIVVVLTKKKG